jgi:hypothetical protein
MMHAALDINIPNYAHAVVTTEQIVASISAAKCDGDHTDLAGRGRGP